MSTTKNLSANYSTLHQTEQIQDESIESLRRTQRLIAEAIQIGEKTSEQLDDQETQLEGILDQVNEVGAKLNKSKHLQGRFDFLAGNWSGRKKQEALREVRREILQRHQEEQAKIREVYELQKFDTFSRSWKPAGLISYTNSNFHCDDLFNPAEQEAVLKPTWAIDSSSTHIDGAGWSYASDFSMLNKNNDGEKTAHWNYYARRRKWTRIEQKGNIADSPAVNEVAKRQDERRQRASEEGKEQAFATTQQFQAPGAINLTNTGYVTTIDLSHPELDEESIKQLIAVQEKDGLANNLLAQLDQSASTLVSLAKNMNSKVKNQNVKIGDLHDGIEKTLDQTATVNARQKHINH